MNTQQVETLHSTPQYVGIPKRFLASVIDGLISSLLVYICVLGRTVPQSPAKVAAYFVLLILIQWAYFALLESSPGQATLGKMALGIIVVNRHGKKTSLGQATLRYFGKSLWVIVLMVGVVIAVIAQVTGGDESPYFITAVLLIIVSLPIGLFSYVMPAFNPEKQALHDRIAKTFVIDAETEAKRLPQKALLQIAAVALVSGFLFHWVPDVAAEMATGSNPTAQISPDSTTTPAPDESPVQSLDDTESAAESDTGSDTGSDTESADNIASMIQSVNLCGISEQTIPPSPHDYLNGVWKVKFTGLGASPHVSVLVMKGASGIMRTEFPDADSQMQKTVLQEMQLRSSPTRLWLLGANPVDAETKKPVDYSPDNLSLQQQPNGQYLVFNCDSLGRSSLATFEFLREKL